MQKGKEIDKLIDSRMERIKSQGKGSLFAGLTLTFEPEDLDWWGDMSKVSVVRARASRARTASSSIPC